MKREGMRMSPSESVDWCISYVQKRPNEVTNATKYPEHEHIGRNLCHQHPEACPFRSYVDRIVNIAQNQLIVNTAFIQFGCFVIWYAKIPRAKYFVCQHWFTARRLNETCSIWFGHAIERGMVRISTWSFGGFRQAIWLNFTYLTDSMTNVAT